MFPRTVTLDSELPEKVRSRMAIIYPRLGDVNITFIAFKSLKNNITIDYWLDFFPGRVSRHLVKMAWWRRVLRSSGSS
jgi:hypothetical protein